MSCISLFVYKNENLYYRVRQEIANYSIVNRNNYVNIELETEEGLMNINQYIIYIQKNVKWGGELEKYARQEIYDINIADYKEIKNNLLNPIYHQNLNQDNDYYKNLCIITQVNNNHFNLIFDASYNAYKDENKRLVLNLITRNINMNKVNSNSTIIKNLIINGNNNNKNNISNIEKNYINDKKDIFIKNNINLINTAKLNNNLDHEKIKAKIYIIKKIILLKVMKKRQVFMKIKNLIVLIIKNI